MEMTENIRRQIEALAAVCTPLWFVAKYYPVIFLVFCGVLAIIGLGGAFRVLKD